MYITAAFLRRTLRRRSREKPASFQRLLIEFCCSHDSKLRTLREAGKGCRLIQVTEKEGGTTQGCRNWLAQEVQSFRENNPQGEVLLYASLSCVGGSPWGYINAMIDTGAERIEQQQKEFASFSNHFENLYSIDRWTTLFNCVRTLKELQVLEVVHGSSIISQETQLEAIPIPRLPVWGH